VKVITSQEAKEIKLPLNPISRCRKIRELAEPLGGLTLLDGGITGALDIPTRERLRKRAFEYHYDLDVKALVEETGLDWKTCETGVGLLRLDARFKGNDSDQAVANEIMAMRSGQSPTSRGEF
jgi:hypothetical protein